MLAAATPNPIVSKICDFLEVLFFLGKSVSLIFTVYKYSFVYSINLDGLENSYESVL